MPNIFHSGLCDCMSDKSGCMDVFCCFPCQVGRQCGAVEGSINTLQLGPCIGALFAPSVCSWCVRKKVVERYSLEEGCCMTLIKGCYFGPCSLCQTHHELTHHLHWPGGTCFQTTPLEMSAGTIIGQMK